MRKKHNIAIVAAVTALSLVMLAGCRELPGKEAADQQLEDRLSGENAVNSGDSLTLKLSDAAAEAGQGIIEAAGAVQDAVEDTAVQVADQINDQTLRQEFSTSLEAGDATELSLDNAVGKIEATASQGNAIQVTAVIVAHNPLTRETAQKIMDNAEVSIERSGSVLKVSTHPLGSPKKDLWTWAQKKYGHSDFSINYSIEIPAEITKYELTNNVGSIQLNDLEGSFNITSNVGTISLVDALITGKSVLQSDTGSITLGLKGMNEGSSLTASSDIGAIKTSLAAGLSCTVKASSELGAISGVAKGKQDYNGGGPLLTLSTEIGAISVRQ